MNKKNFLPKLLVFVLLFSGSVLGQDKVLFLDSSKALTFNAFNFYETNKVDKTTCFFKSSLVPGYGFGDIGDETKGVLYFLGGVGTLGLALSAKEEKNFQLFLLGFTAIRIYEYVDLSSSIDRYNEKLRYQIRATFKLQ